MISVMTLTLSDAVSSSDDIITLASRIIYVFFMSQQLLVGQGLLFIEFSRRHAV